MTIETEVANLTAAISNLTDTVNLKKVALDDAVDEAQAAQAAAEAALATLVQITVVSVLNSVSEIPDPPASNTLYLIRA